MSTMINVGPMIAKIARDLLEGGTSVLSVDSVYDRLMAVYGDDQNARQASSFRARKESAGTAGALGSLRFG